MSKRQRVRELALLPKRDAAQKAVRHPLVDLKG